MAEFTTGMKGPEAIAKLNELHGRADISTAASQAAALSAQQAQNALDSITGAVVVAGNTLADAVAAVEAAKNTAVNTSIPAAVALVDQAVAETAAGAASASAATALSAASSAQESAATAAAAASEAVDSAAGIYTSTAVGLAATVSGQYFAVKQPYGGALDYYQNNAGAATYQLTKAFGTGQQAEDIALLESAARAVTQYPVAPYALIQGVRGLMTNGRETPDKINPGASNNIYSFPTVDIRFVANSSITVTREYANGPIGARSAARVLLGTAAAQAYFFQASSAPVIAGTYTIRFKVKSAPGSGNQDIRYGSPSGPSALTAVSLTEGAWTTCQFEFTTTGADYRQCCVTGSGSNLADFLIDEIQFYEGAAASVPSWASEVFGGAFRRTYAYQNSQKRIGFSFDNSALGGSGILRLPTFPATKNFTELTAIVAFKNDVASNNGPVVCADYDTTLGTSLTNFALGVLTSGELMFYPSPINYTKVNVLGEGWHIMGIRLKSNARSIYFHEIELAADTTAFAGFLARLLRIGSTGASLNTQLTTWQMRGEHAQIAVFDKHLSDDEYYTAVQSVRERVSLYGKTLAPMPAFLIAMGDSQTASMSGARGPSWAFLQADAGRFTPRINMRSLAVGGYTLANLVSQLPELVRVIAQVKKLAGRKAIVAIYTGTNDQVAIVASPSAFWASVESTLLAPIVAAGGIPIVGTLCPDGGSPPTGFESARIALNIIIRASGYAVMDFGGDAVMGNVANCSGPYYDIDKRHFSTLGQSERLAPIAQPVIQSAINN